MVGLYIIVGVVVLGVGALAGWLLMRPREAALQQRLQAAEAERERKASVEATLTSQLDNLRQENVALQSERSSLNTELKLLREQSERDDKRRTEAFERQLAMAKEQMQNETRQVLEQRAEALGKSNNEQMNGVVAPLKEQLAAMQKQVNETLKSSAANSAAITTSIEVLMRRTEQMVGEANSLARALRNENRTQGNWGEMILDTILANSGLEKGVHYETQVTLRDAGGRPITGEESGQRMIPDVIVHYPDDKDVIIDSKVSLTAYLDYCNAEDDVAREAARRRHLESVHQHVRELRSKNYSRYIPSPRQALQYMIMFVPNDAALQLALQSEPALWQEAFDSGICITSEQGLIVLLRMIQMSWSQVQQIKNQQEIMKQATLVLDRVALFMERFAKVDSGINDLRRRYDEANLTLTGRQSILSAAKTMEKLGAKTSTQRSLPNLPEQVPDEENANKEKEQ